MYLSDPKDREHNFLADKTKQNKNKNYDALIAKQTFFLWCFTCNFTWRQIIIDHRVLIELE
ncbi:hypothetical protein DERF_003277 [Dermatophagoides farinae]|uniref:Uncharacterized protein n=1 Tax=Dermatophagoides farinae TaxID=6954 RepID=A0A922LDI5_DERFA|nr:hypothetical protein DERF_003277 [Dermatophagoides farinae]